MRFAVAYAEPDRAIVKEYVADTPVRVSEALSLAMADAVFAGVDLTGCPVGIFGRIASRDQVLEPGDRLEVYRALAHDPKLARRTRVREARRASRRIVNDPVR